MTHRELAIGIIRRLRRQGHDALLAGGCVRDRLLGRRPKDYDVATSARPAEVEKLFGKTLSIGAQFGVIVVLDGDARVEVATFRSDEAYTDGRHPVGVRFTTAAEDARRRDFTINALFHDPIRRETIDYVGGRRDLERGLVRAVGNAEARFREDHLRMLRAVRFASRLGFRLGGTTRRAIRDLAPLVTRVSAERVRDELATILTEPTRADGVRLADKLGLLEQILPEVTALKGCRQGRRHHPEGDVWRHTLLCLEHLRRPTFPLALATLLHDIGKPATADYARGEVHFYRHQQVGAEMAGRVARRLKLSGAETSEVRWLVHHHLDFMHARQMRPATLRRLFQSPHFRNLAELHRADLLGSCTDLADHRYVLRRFRALSQEEIRPEPLATGHDLMALGMPAGPALGELLRTLYDEQLEGCLTNRRQARARARRLISEESEK
jgi:poly(A) polymerase